LTVNDEDMTQRPILTVVFIDYSFPIIHYS